MAIKQLGKYDIIERLGRGGMAEVYKAYQASLDRYVAIKLLHPFLADDPEFKDRFEREARNVARLRHPNIVQVYDFEYDEANESYYMVMELIDGSTLKDRMDAMHTRGEHPTLEEILRVIRGAGEALSYAHARGMIHRDVKPANLMLDSDGRIVLTDFGIAKIVTGIQFTASGGMVGTPAYMAPEQGLGEQGDERSDIYSLGVILFQLCTGSLPYDAETPLAVILKHLNEPIPSVRKQNPDIPEALEAVIHKAIAKDPEDRFQTADEMLKQLDRSGEVGLPPPPVSEPPSAAEAASPAPGAPDTIKLSPVRRPGRVGIGAAAVGGLVLLIGLVMLGGGKLPLIGIKPTDTATVTITPNPTLTPTHEPTVTPSITPSATFTASATASQTATATPTASLTPTFTASATATLTATFTATATFTPTFTPTATFSPTFTATPTATYTPTFTPTWTNSPTATATFTPSLTPTPTINITATLQAATSAAQNLTATSDFLTLDAIRGTLRAQVTNTPNYTATALKCRLQYLVVQPKPPPEKDPIPADKDFERDIILRNTGDCDWLPGAYLSFSSGESFSAPIKIPMENQQPVPPNAEARFIFKGHTPRKGGLYSGTWEVRLYPDNKLLDPLLTIAFYAYE